MSPRSTHKAFSLIEVMVAMAIAAVAFTVLSQTFVNTLRVLGSLTFEANRENDLRFVRSQIILEPDRDTFEDGGEIETLNFGTARWEAEIEETSVVDLFLVRLRIELSGGNNTDPSEHEETLYLLRPTWSDPIDRSIILENARDALEDERGTLEDLL